MTNKEVKMATQNEFMQWLKDQGLYCKFDSAAVMRSKQALWEKAKAFYTNVGREEAICTAETLDGEDY